MPEAPASRSKIPVLLLALLGVQVAWGAVRVPEKAIARRRDEIARFQELGAARSFLDHAGYVGAEAIAWIRDHTEPGTVVLYEGALGGALEFAPGLLAPRLLVATSACPVTNTTYAGLPLARAQLSERDGVVCLVATEQGLRVEVR